MGDQNVAPTSWSYDAGTGPLGGNKNAAVKKWAERGVIRKGGQVTTVGATNGPGPVAAFFASET